MHRILNSSLNNAMERIKVNSNSGIYQFGSDQYCIYKITLHQYLFACNVYEPFYKKQQAQQFFERLQSVFHWLYVRTLNFLNRQKSTSWLIGLSTVVRFRNGRGKDGWQKVRWQKLYRVNEPNFFFQNFNDLTAASHVLDPKRHSTDQITRSDNLVWGQSGKFGHGPD